MVKEALYRTFIARMDAAIASGTNFEAVWYAYAIVEDRLQSLVSKTGPDLIKANGHTPSMKAKLDALDSRAKTDSKLGTVYNRKEIDNWSKARNALTHAMANGSKSLVDIDRDALNLAVGGSTVVREICVGVRRFKK